MVKICLIDDDQNILASLSLALKSEKFEVETFSDGISGLEALNNDDFDIAILDIKMPRIDGLEVLQRLRTDSDIPVIFLTSKDDEIDQLLGLKMGADDYITKPFSQKLLIERVKTILRRGLAIKSSDLSNKDTLYTESLFVLDDPAPAIPPCSNSIKRALVTPICSPDELPLVFVSSGNNPI